MWLFKELHIEPSLLASKLLDKIFSEIALLECYIIKF